MAESSRKGRSIARKACDLCRERKIQCVFNHEISSTTCQKCQKAEVPCTFLTTRKPRGPPSRRVAEAKQRAATASTSDEPQTPTTPSFVAVASPSTTTTTTTATTSFFPQTQTHQVHQPHRLQQLPVGHVSITDFVPEYTLKMIIDDFFDRVYPVLPIVHVATYQAAFDARRYETDPVFLRLTISLCAATVASIPRRITVYGSSLYADVGQMVDRASQLILLSRLGSEPMWQDQPTMDTMLVSLALTIAALYAGRTASGWSYAGEAILYFRALELYKKASYVRFTPIEAEMCKRAFWLLFIFQIHDRMSFVIPHTGLSYDPLSTDWDFLLPLELADDEIGNRALDQMPSHAPRDRPLPMISGFIALIKVFLCIVDLLHKAFPGPPQAYHLSSGTLVPRLLDNDERQKPKFQGSIPTLDSLFHVMTRLNTTLSNLPPELRMPRRRGSPATYDAERGALPAVSPQFDIMRANVHITSIYLQSMILEMCLDKVERSDHGARAGSQGTSPASDPATPDTSAREQLWQLKESVARELLDVVHYCSAWTLESNGSSMIVKIREIAATLLERSEGSGVLSDVERRSREYIAQFVEILANLDYAPRSLVGFR
ncbi:hypothetical protein HYQ45_006850 [Verticillium longisporum]|uniref:Zn(2)-C6 fungal-type domain-containing protein n=1 Tax=Verticillium longisporum TaxID=100787 RepID=A0A8I2ZN72_VERLO|nr:hypothetical protein HYQ44_010569 [Verticillium longisporum]KAG7135404.1 hypothetical protein HYQ45_006850 [Verticillium longisporum]